jgi:LysR family transcriptional activator of nhaA
MRQLASLEIDLALTDTVPGDLDKLGLEHRVVHTARLLMVAAPRLASQTGTLADGAVDFPLIHHAASSRVRGDIDAHFQRRNIRPELIGEVDDVGVMVRAALDGISLAIVPETVIEDALRRGALIALGQLDDLACVVHALYQQRERAQAVIDAIERLTQPTVRRIAA